MKMRENKFIAIYNEIADDIKSGLIKAKTKLPSENELSIKYETSRETIRKALTLLSQNGLIQKVKGKGSIVLDVNKFNFPISGLVSFKELSQNMGKRTSTAVREFGLIQPDEIIKNQLNVSSKDEVWKVFRTRKIDDENIILDKDYFLRKYVPFLTSEICENSIYEYLEKELSLNISFAKKEITVEDCTDEDQSY